MESEENGMTITKNKKRLRLIPQVMILFAIGIVITGIITFITESSLSDKSIREQTEARTREMATEAAAAVREFPASNWLLSYWYTHPDDMDIEYDALYKSGSETEEKSRVLTEHCPDVQLKYATEEQIKSMEPEDQKLYAEIAYSWLLTRFDQIKNSYDISYLFCVVSDQTFKTQYFIMSAAQPGVKRGPGDDEAYPVGKIVQVDPERQKAMRRAKAASSYLAYADEWVDYYVWIGEAEGDPVFLGLTYSLSELQSLMDSQAAEETLYASLLQLFLCFICLLLIYFFVLRPLNYVQDNIHLYRETKDSSTVSENLQAIKTNNEIGELADNVADMTVEIDEYIEKIQKISAEKQRISTELDLAEKIQNSMIPHTFPAYPERKEFDIYANMKPAKEVSGDFYDFALIDDDHLEIVIADVAGKGVPAALFMMASKIILQGCTKMTKSPAEILIQTNDVICSNNSLQMFVTVWLGILEISTGKLIASNAGHEYPALKESPDGDFEFVKRKHDFVIGGMPDMNYTEYEIQLKPGSKLFLYTDGVPEATDADDNMFGADRLLETLNSERDAAPDKVLDNVHKAVDGFVKDAEQFDDMTMLCLEYKGK